LAAGGTLEDRPRYNKTRCFETFPFPAPGEPEKARIRQLAEDLDGLRKARQALYPGLTLTGMYNCLEQLRRGEPLTPKDKVIHEQGLVSVLRQIHDELDAAVLAACGWKDLTEALLRGSAALGATGLGGPSPAAVAAMAPLPQGPALLAQAEVEEEILHRLVALNAERTLEERRGLVRWLRPDFQNPGGAPGSVGVPPASGPEARAPGGRDAPAPWPKTLPDQIQALRAALATQAGPVSAADLAQAFARAPRGKVAELLDTLANLGLARRLDDARYLPG
jgi:hypothetical protein